jgi:histidyl-tRNA synthetase
MGGPPTAGIGFGAGMERLYLLLEALKLIPEPAGMDIAVVPMQDAAEHAAWAIAQSLRHAGFKTDIAYKGKGGKRLQRADKLGARFAVVIGDDELQGGAVTIKNLKDGSQETVGQDQLIATLRDK